jgi:hypothetical protein
MWAMGDRAGSELYHGSSTWIIKLKKKRGRKQTKPSPANGDRRLAGGHVTQR